MCVYVSIDFSEYMDAYYVNDFISSKSEVFFGMYVCVYECADNILKVQMYKYADMFVKHC